MIRRWKLEALCGIPLCCLLLAGLSCQPGHESARLPPPAPTLKITPLQAGDSQWQVAATPTITATVNAPQATRVRLLSHPEGMAEENAADHLLLATQTAPPDPANGAFTWQVQLPPDFAGEVWAEVSYANGLQRDTASIPLTTDTAATDQAALANVIGGSAGTDESARSDKLTGGRIVRGTLKPGDTDVRITINLPAFLLTLWQSGKEIKSYHVGIGRQSFPVPVGEREAKSLIFNPDWIPPNSAWVQGTAGVEPYEHIAADDPRNPLGKIKIPLGEGYLIHEAAHESEIGRPVSHGCIRMRRADLFDLANKIITARNLPVTSQQLAQVQQGTERLPVPLATPLLVDINYDLQVVEGRVLRLYPDVYERGAFNLDNLRAELQSAGVNVTKLPDEKLQELLDRVSTRSQFAISVADIKQGHWQAGGTLPLTVQLVARIKTSAGQRAATLRKRRQLAAQASSPSPRLGVGL